MCLSASLCEKQTIDDVELSRRSSTAEAKTKQSSWCFSRLRIVWCDAFISASTCFANMLGVLSDLPLVAANIEPARAKFVSTSMFVDFPLKCHSEVCVAQCHKDNHQQNVPDFEAVSRSQHTDNIPEATEATSQAWPLPPHSQVDLPVSPSKVVENGMV